MSTADDAFLEKLRKMRAMAHDPSLTEAEAALWAGKLASLLAERGLEMADLAETERVDHVESQKFEMMYADPWRMSLFRAAEKLYFCYSFGDWYERGGVQRKCRTVVGRPHNVATLVSTYQYLEQTTLRLASAYVRTSDVENDVRLGGTTTRAARIGFERGCGERLAQRLRELYAAQARPEVVTSGGLPALYKNELALAKTFAESNFSLRTGRARGSDINAHGSEGARAANSVSLSAQLSGRSAKRGNLLS